MRREFESIKSFPSATFQVMLYTLNKFLTNNSIHTYSATFEMFHIIFVFFVQYFPLLIFLSYSATTEMLHIHFWYFFDTIFPTATFQVMLYNIDQ